MGALTATAIVADALKRAGNESLTTEGLEWLNDLLDRLYEDYRWPEQEEHATGTLTIGQTSVDLPSDFNDLWSRKGLRIVDSHGSTYYLTPQPTDYLDTIINPDIDGLPNVAIVDFAALTWRPFPLPSKAFTWKLRYKVKPVRVSGGDTPLFRNDAIMKQGVYVQALQHEDDERYPRELTILERMIERYLKGRNIGPSRNTAMRLGNAFITPGALR